MKKIVITGGPCSGKTTLIDKLKNSGEVVLTESATTLINQQLQIENGILPWTKFEEFEKLLLDFQISKENELNELAISRCFLDRGVIDVLAYYEFQQIPITTELFLKIDSVNRYDKVFFLESLPEKYWNDHTHNFQRLISYSDGIKISSIILNKYIELDYNPIIIPLDSVDIRCYKIYNQL